LIELGSLPGKGKKPDGEIREMDQGGLVIKMLVF
jgi:hypothetical protein